MAFRKYPGISVDGGLCRKGPGNRRRFWRTAGNRHRSVSYTHLDVYKRQDVLCEHEIVIDPIEEILKEEDVYKRQGK